MDATVSPGIFTGIRPVVELGKATEYAPPKPLARQICDTSKKSLTTGTNAKLYKYPIALVLMQNFEGYAPAHYYCSITAALLSYN